jgi:phosphatidylinositol alpha-1,6-mannosyltransferase
MRRRVLLITRNLPPLLGGMERLNWHIAAQLAVSEDVRVIGPAGAAMLAPEGVAVREVRVYPLAFFLMKAWWHGMCEALRWKPHVVLAGSGLMAPLAWLMGRCVGARVMVYVHGLDIIVPHAIYRRVWLSAIRRADGVVANSRATAKLAEQAGVVAGRISVIHPGVDVPPSGEQREKTSMEFRRKYGLAASHLLLSVGRLTQRKGLQEFVSEVLPLVVKERPDVLLLIVGDSAIQALYGSAQTPAAIRSAAEAAGVGDHVRFLGKLAEDELHAAYCAADVHVFPIRNLPGDVEGFGMVAVEAAAHGLPTVAYACGGVVDAVGENISGRLVAAGDGAGFAEAVLRTLSEPMEPLAMRRFASRFEWKNFGAALQSEVERISCGAEMP